MDNRDDLDDEGPIDWRLDRVGPRATWSEAQLDAMALLTAPGVGASLCPGRVSVRLDGTWACTSDCTGPPSWVHTEGAVVDCSRTRTHTCVCWQCLESRLPFCFAVHGYWQIEWVRFMGHARQAEPDSIARFSASCDARSLAQPDGRRIYSGVERWLLDHPREGLVDRYPRVVQAGSVLFDFERAVCTAAVLLEREADVLDDLNDDSVVADRVCNELARSRFETLWADLLESCGLERALAPVAVALAESITDLRELLDVVGRASG